MATTWEAIVKEMNSIGTPDRCDIIRRKKISALKELTGRNTVIYATDFLGEKARLVNSSIDLTDKEGFIEVTKNLKGDALDVLLHSPGGQAEAAESIVYILRAKFSNIRFIIPSAAKSAATMLAMSGNILLMDERSEMGPTDPQLIVNRDGQRVVAPAHAIKEQFQLASRDITNNPQKLTLWLPILRQYGPSLLSECDRSLNLSNQLVAKWLKAYMFNGEPRAAAKASRVAKYLTSKVQFQSHARRIGIDDLQRSGVKILDLRTDSKLQTAVWELYTSIYLTFEMTGAFKIFENHNSEALIRSLQLLAPPNVNSNPTR